MRPHFLLLLTMVFILPSPIYALDKNGNFESKKEQDQFIAKALKEMAKEINQQTPIMIDSETKLQSALAVGKTLTYSATIINATSNQVNAQDLNRMVWGNINAIACKNKATRGLIDLGVSYIYIYFGNDNRIITRVVLNSYECN